MKLRFRSDAQGPKERLSGFMLRLAPLVASALVVIAPLLFSVAHAHQHEAPSCLVQAGSSMPTVADDWRVVADASSGLAFLLPRGHVLAPNDGTWYVHGMMNGEPLVPDVGVRLHANQTAQEVARELFAAGATLEAVRLGPAAQGFRVAIPGRTDAEGYLAVTAEGTYSIVRYEEFDWDGFDQVACSFHLIELL